MSEPDPNQPHPPPLEYAPADPTQYTRRAVALISGVVTGIVAVLVAGFLEFTNTNHNIGGPPVPRPTSDYVASGVFFVLAGGAIVGFIYYLTASPRRRWFLMGLSAGAAAMALVE